MSYQYEALGEGCIRLMVLKAGAKDDGIAIELETVHLGMSPPYEAISYVWGYAPGKTEIVSSRASFTVTENLGEALQSFRREDHDRALWADAICINQSDPVERAQQVKLMAQIFGYAGQVLVWLGPFDFAQQAFQAASNLACDRQYEVDLINHLRNEWPSAAISFLRQLAQRPWFQRTWTMQEIGVAYQATVYCGDASISWEDLSRAYHILYEQVEIESPDFMRLPVIHLRDIRALRAWKHDLDISFLDLLALASRRHATDARDKVFALLSHPSAFADDEYTPGQLLIEPDYSKDVVEVYTDTAKALIRRDRNLDVLSHAEEFRYLQPENLASWVPDWSRPSRHRNLLCSQKDFAAAAGFPLEDEMPDDEPFDDQNSDEELPCKASPHETPHFKLSYFGVWELHARGIYLGSVRWQRNLALWNTWPALPTMPMVYKELTSAWIGMSQDQRHKSSKEELLSVFGRCLSGGMLHPAYNGPHGTQRHDRDFQFLWQDIEARQGQATDTGIRKGFLDSILYACQGRSLFCTDTGLFGLGPTSMRTGDQVFVVELGRMPLTLRANEIAHHWSTFVGECYVDGMMHGEAARLRDPVRKLTLR